MRAERDISRYRPNGIAAIRLGIDAVGGAATDRLASCLAEGVTLLNYGMMSGEPCQLSPRYYVFKDVMVKGFWLAKWFRTFQRAAYLPINIIEEPILVGLFG